MNRNSLNGNLFIQQVSKLFEDLSAKQPEKAEVNPRITCTRLRRLREMRRELVLDSDLDLGSQLISHGTIPNKSCERNTNESFADWVLRNQQSHQQFLDKQNSHSEEIKKKTERESSKTIHGFANFSPSALQLVAQNPRTPLSTLKWLAAHNSADVRQALAVNSNVCGDILNVLVGDNEDRVREAVLDNQNITHTEVLRLCDDQSPLIAEKAKNILYQMTKRNTADRPSMTATANMDVCLPSTGLTLPLTKPVLDNFSTQQSIEVEREFLKLIAEKSTTPPRRLAELATHVDSAVRCLVAANSNATEEIFWQLAKDPLPEVRMKLIDNYNCPAEIIEYLRKTI